MASGSRAQTGAPLAFSGGVGWAPAGSRPRRASPPRSPPTNSTGRSSGSRRTRATPARTPRSAGAAEACRRQPHRAGHPRLSHAARAARLQRGRRPRHQGRGGADGPGRGLEAPGSSGCRARAALATCARCCASSRVCRRRLSQPSDPAMAWHGSLALDYRERDGRTRSATATTARCGCCRAFIPRRRLPQRAGASAGRHRRRRRAGDRDRARAPAPRARHHPRRDALLPQRWAEPATQTLDGPRRRRTRGSSGCRSRPSPTAAAAPRTGCASRSRRGAEMIGWDVTALGLPASEQPFVAGRFTQSIELPGPLAGARHDRRRRRARCSTRRSAGPGSACWRRCGSPPAARSRAAPRSPARRRRAAAATRHPLRPTAGATAPHQAWSWCACWRRGSSRRWLCCSRDLARLAPARLAARRVAAARLAHLSAERRARAGPV